MTSSLGRIQRCIVLSLLIGAPVLADWDEGGPHKMHQPQLPDLALTGIDVQFNHPIVLADDFLCTESGPITNIHIWGSWFTDVADTNAAFDLAIHADIPTNSQQLYSKPAIPPLWAMTFAHGQYTARLWATNLAEGWYIPSQGEYFPPFPPPPPDTECVQFNFPVPEGQQFMQTNGVIYWLSVHLRSQEGTFGGWKTATNHWNDDAVFWNFSDWVEMRYPAGHPYHPASMDLAFVIDGGEIVHEIVRCPKWYQQPDCNNGLDVESWGLWSDGLYQPGPRMVADDWWCDGRPVVGVKWWGSYIGWETNNPAMPPPPAIRPVAFKLTWYTDIPASGGGFSQPGVVLATNIYPLGAFGAPVSGPGLVAEQNYCVTPLGYIAPNVFEHEYEYEVIFKADEEWNEKEGRVYWLSIEALYPQGNQPGPNPWGWKTTPPDWNWNDDAVSSSLIVPWDDMIYPPPGWGWIEEHPYEGQSVNMSFALLTDVCPGRCKKWAQPPDMVLGDDRPSWIVEGQPEGSLRADDFVSDGRPITDIHWWGSYIGWQSQTNGNPEKPVSHPTGINQVKGFKLSWHAGDPACKPGTELVSVTVSVTNCHETYFGTVNQYWKLPQQYEHEYQYYVDLLDPDIDLSSWLETNNVHYWLDIQAIFDPAFIQPEPPHQGWGWKITTDTNLCLSVVKQGSSDWTNDVVQYPWTNREADLAFELTTTEIPTNPPAVIRFTRMRRDALTANNLYMWSTGYCGCGKLVLQQSTNLPAGDPAWSDAWTNPLPRPENLWKSAANPRFEFYRLRQTN